MDGTAAACQHGFLVAEPPLASIYRAVPRDYLKRGDELCAPAPLTDAVPQLSGIVLSDVMASIAAAPLPDGFLDDIDATRGQALRMMADTFATRLRDRFNASAHGCEPALRTLNPLVAVQSAPGGGKRTLLDCAALLSARGMWSRFCSDAGMRKALDASVPVCVTFSRGYEPGASHADADTGTALSLRLLHSFYVQQRMPFREFAALLPRGHVISPRDAVDCCLEGLPAGKRGILLLLDDIMAWGERSSALTNILGVLGNNVENLNVVCATVDPWPVDQEAIHGRRFVTSLPLPPLPQAAAERMLQRALGLPKLSLGLRTAISDCSGHPRMLQYLMQAAAELYRADPWHWMEDDRRLLQQLQKAVVGKLPRPGAWAARAALDGHCLDLYKSVPYADDAGRRVRLVDHIAGGTFTNSSICRGCVAVPTTSVMGLLAAGTVGDLGGIVQDVAAVAQLPAGRKPFGDFITQWLQLRLTLVSHRLGYDSTPRHTSAYDLLELLSLSTSHWKSVEAHSRALPHQLKQHNLRSPPSVGVVRTKQRLDKYLDRAATATTTAATSASGHKGLPSNVIFTFPANNQAFNKLLLLDACGMDGDGRRVAIAIDARRPKSIGSPAARRPIVRHWRRQVQLLADKCGVRPECCMLVSLAGAWHAHAAGSSERLSRETLHAHAQAGVVVLDRADAAAVFTPSLSDRAFLMMDLEAKRADA